VTVGRENDPGPESDTGVDQSPLDPAVREELITSNLGLAHQLARRFLHRGEPLDDLVQVGAVGLVAAARRFDPKRGVPFVAYAVPTIDGELRRHLRDRASAVRIPRREQELAAMLRRTAQLASQRLGREASLAETAAAAGVSPAEAGNALVCAEAPAPLASLAKRASATAAAEMEACEQRALVDDLLDMLDPRERQIVRLRFGDDLSQHEIARRLSMSQSQASRVLRGALEKLRRSAGPGLHEAA
jgi:RNA polymerase sigma-B factor